MQTHLECKGAHTNTTITRAHTHTHTHMHPGGNLDARSLYLDPTYGVLPQLEKLRSWLEVQASVQFFQASLLFTYEGEAGSLDEANVQVLGAELVQ